MEQIVKITQFALRYLPSSVKVLMRKIIPVRLKFVLGQKVMADVYKAGGIVTVNDGRQFNIIEDGLFLRVYYEKDYESSFSAVAIGLLEKNDFVVDVGANFGWYTTLFSKHIEPEGRVIAYEPAPDPYEKLISNIKLNDMESSVVVKKSCAGDVAGTIYLEQGTAGESGLAHVVEKKADSTIEVPVVRLDDDLSDVIGKIAYIKIDVEGFELSTLKGATKMLEAPNQPIIQIELNPEALERAGTSRADVVQFLKSLGYSFWEVVPGKLGKLRKSDVSQCSDVFCFGAGKYGERVKLITI